MHLDLLNTLIYFAEPPQNQTLNFGFYEWEQLLVSATICFIFSSVYKYKPNYCQIIRILFHWNSSWLQGIQIMLSRKIRISSSMKRIMDPTKLSWNPIHWSFLIGASLPSFGFISFLKRWQLQSVRFSPKNII